MAAPGKYAVRLTVDGQAFTQPLTIVKNPKADARDADLSAAFQFQLRIRDDITKTATTVNKLEWMRKQLDVIARMLGGRKEPGKTTPPDNRSDAEPREPEQPKEEANPDPELLKAVEAMDQKMQDAEYKFISRGEALSDDKYFSVSEQVYLKLLWLNAEVGTGGGDVAGGVDHAPTETAKEILQALEKELGDAQNGYQNLVDQDLPAFNKMLLDKGITPIAFARPAETDNGDDEGG
jgi:hypothetical protein